ncbi:CAP domain-containing protein [Bacillus ectoiniformans]|uniref:CAP domain-containing protein n=1 Tax=Bacillus ectoiniformans TaxID=1494429 RepID=UPI003B836891
MRSVIRILIVMSIIVIATLYMNNMEEKQVLENSSKHPKIDTSNSVSVPEEHQISPGKMPVKGIGSFIGKQSGDLKTAFGEPIRKDPSAYEYEWWVYKDDKHYVQFGVEHNQVVTAYATGKTEVAPFKIGQPANEIFAANVLDTEIVINHKKGNYRFELSEEDFNIRPLVRLGDIYVQLYLDKFTGTLSSVRYLSKETLIKQRPYEMVYRGKLLSAPEPDDLTWKEIEQGSEKQILDITNMIRKRFDLSSLQEEINAAEVAKLHSREMHDKQYFAHESPSKGNLGDRLDSANINYRSAGENIAANYVDAPAAVEGWLNSEGHRETLLGDFTHLGVGVYKKYYTQNFITH